MQGRIFALHVPKRSLALTQQLTATLYYSNLYVQSFTALRVWATPVNFSNPYLMVIQSYRRPVPEYICRYTGLQSSEIAAIIPWS